VRVPPEKLNRLAQTKERRRFRRVQVDLPGRYMLADGCEHLCRVVDISAGGMALITPTTGTVGERAIAYVDHIGRLEGVIARVYPDGLPRASATSSPPN
jgi:c-di-GMP-binding flagellar brake protein YcgR